MSLSWRGRSLLRIAPALPALRRHGSGVGSSKNSQRNRHSAALRFPQLDFWTGIVSECPVIRPQLPTELEAIRWEPTVEEDRTG